MLKIRRPEPKAALTWMAVWFIALIGLALVPMGETNSEMAGTPGEIHYDSGATTVNPSTNTLVRQSRG
ncbi:MAG: hypothetical protein VCD66_16760 [Alphaproteobacteria bacterium]|jgi:hypothetical protein